MKNSKTPGPNRITPELIKLLDEEAKEQLLDLLNKCWEGELFEEMSKSDLAGIYQKGPTNKPVNYRPIALLSLGYKLMASMIQNILFEAMDDRTDPAQFGFRKGRSTVEPIHIHGRIQEIHEEAGLELVTLLLDWEKAFDKIHQGKLLSALRRIGIPDNVVRFLLKLYIEARSSQ